MGGGLTKRFRESWGQAMNDDNKTRKAAGDIAIVGMSVHVPGSGSVSQFWDNLRDGVESIRRLDQEALIAAGERPDLISNPAYVPAAAPLDAFDHFDPDFFGFSPKEAAIFDPQHRQFLETAWEAMEDAGHPPETVDGKVGVFAGCGMGSYFYFNICSNPGLVDEVGMFLLRHTGNDKDFLSTRVSHVFDLKGPSVNIQTACSTSLVAVHYACKALRDGECDMALAGGVTIELPQGRGYLYKENEILSPDGHCHAFDHRAQGTVFGSGAGTVVLRRLEDALADGDHIWAVIKGSAINNDGAAKAGYLAPSVDGQAEAVAAALDNAGVPAETVDYVECHGTGTYLGDPIEVSALSEAYRRSTEDTGFCRIGSVKTNIGHLDTAAGVASLVKASLALNHRQMPPSLGFEKPNPAIDFDSSPFRVNDTLRDWTPHKGPRRAGVNALGVGGTNAHVVLEEAPERGASDDSDFPFHILCLSARSKSALDGNASALAAHLRAHPDLSLADVAFTLKQGRRAFEKRRVLVAETAEEAAALLEQGDTRRVFTHDALPGNPDVVFMFPGGGAQYTDMARDLYETEPVFAEWMDRGLDHLTPQLDFDPRALWMPGDGDRAAAEARLKQPSAQLPLIMIVEYALAQLWISWGVRPAALVGHSMGENTAACLAGVMSFEDCIDLVLLRGRLFDTVPAGGMLSISLSEPEVQALIGDDLDIASVNAPDLVAVSGPQAALDRLAEVLTGQEVEFQRVPIDIAAHSRMLDPILGDFHAFLERLDLKPPALPVISNRTGAALSAERATDPGYWTEQLRNTVLFADCIDTLAAEPGRVFLEVRPGKALSSLTQMNPHVSPNQVLSSLRHPGQDIADDSYFFGVIGRLWALGVEADWDQIWGEAKRHRLPLPTYAFQRSRFFIEPGEAHATQAPAALTRTDDLTGWGYRPAWRPRLADCGFDIAEGLTEAPRHRWLFFADDHGLAARLADDLRAAGQEVAMVTSGDSYARLDADTYVLGSEQGQDAYAQLLSDLAAEGRFPDRIAHFWLVTQGTPHRPGSSFYLRNIQHGFNSLMALGQALGGAMPEHPVHLSVVTNGAIQVRDEALPHPEKALIAGPVGVLPRELPGLTCSALDLDWPVDPPARGGLFARAGSAQDPERVAHFAPRLIEELFAEPANLTAAWRGERRFEKGWKPAALDAAAEDAPVYRDGGTYLITGGLGGIGLTVARDLLRLHKANVALISRTALPPRADWENWLRRHGPGDRVAARLRALMELEDLGGSVRVLSADIANIDQMRAAVDRLRAEFGHIDGVIHAAGRIDDGPVLAKSLAGVEQVFAPKITGLKVLDSLFPDGSVDLMVLFASSSTVTTPAGQIDYVAANTYLNAWANHRKGGKTRVCAVNWGVWADTGMAAEAMRERTGDTEDTRAPVAEPLLDEAGFDRAGNRLFHARWCGRTHWVLDQHRTAQGAALLPGTGYLELAAEALEASGVSGGFTLRDLYFLRALPVADDRETEAIVRLSPTADGFGFELFSRVAGQGWALHAQADLDTAPPVSTSPPLDLSAIAARCPQAEQAAPDGRLTSPQEAHLRFGPRWHVLRRTALGEGEGLAELALPEALRGDLDDGYRLHPGLLDLATGWAMQLIRGYGARTLWVPVAYQSVQVLAALPAEIRSWVRLTPGATPIDGFVSFDVTLTDPDGRVLAEIAGFQMKRLGDGFDLTPQADVSDSDLGLSGAATVPLSPEEERLFQTVRLGIRADEGAEALRRALASGLNSVVVSPLDLDGLIAQAALSTPAEAEAGQSFDRPDLDCDYVEPGNDIQRTLAGMWEGLLGVSQVGVEDSFFDLGGHSLIAVRLFAQINKTYGVQFPISVLFEAPTIAKLAAQIAERMGYAGDDAAPAPEGALAQRAFDHLVALHQGDRATGTPLFIVAGMFGNVLNLRHLALLLGQDRPVYGLQARGLIGADEPHRRIEEAAAAYIAELRQVQPEGPYMLGGFSGGGITAYEMARQLTEEGEEVSVLALLDTPLPIRPSLTRRDKALIKLSDLRRKGVGFLGEWARNRLEWEIAKRRGQEAAGTSPAAAFNNRKIEAAFREAVGVYQVQPWDGPLTLFRPPLDRHWQVSGGQWVSAEREYVFEDNDWTRYAPALEVIEVPGDHDSMVLVPNVSVMAERFREVIARAERGQAPMPSPVPGAATAAE